MCNERNKLIFERITQGETQASLAVEYGISKQAVNNIYVKELLNKKCLEADNYLDYLIYKYSSSLWQTHFVKETFKMNNIKTVYDLDSIPIEKLCENIYFVYGWEKGKDVTKNIIIKIKKKVKVMIRKGF